MSADKKLEVIRLVESSILPRRQSLARLNIAPTTYYRWRGRFKRQGAQGASGSVSLQRPGLESDPARGGSQDQRGG